MKSELLLCAALILSTSPALAQAQAGLGPEPFVPAGEYSYHPSTGDQPKPVELPSDTGRRTGTAWVLRAGAFSGVGKASPDCVGDCGALPEAEGYDEQSAAVLSADWLSSSSRNLRLGMGVQLIPMLATQMNGERYELGTVAGTDFVLEGVVDVSEKTALTLRASAGLSLLFPSGELEDDTRANADACADYDCTASSGPYFGGQVSVGAGVLYNLGRIGARVDFQAQAYTFRTLEVEAGGNEASVLVAGVRPMLLAGIEL